ncbi:MAG: hypothetical protein VX038_05750 [Verrucomicrobiota bacterium]|nr:hypothetical protein [Verrucomicrobiota bacterium]
MLKIPTFILGGLLILTGLAGYLFQDPGLSLKLTGPLADDAEFALSDGNETIVLDLGYPSSKSAGEHAFWVVHLLNQNHARDRSQGNYAIEQQGTNDYVTKSFWHASSKGDTQSALVLHAETGELVDLAETDANSSKIRLVYKNFTGTTAPVTLSSTNWNNVESKVELKPGDSLEFSKSWTAFIPGIIGIILIILAQGAEMKPNARKHIMHVAVLIGLIGFIMLAFRMLPRALSEMNWLKGETYGIIHASSLKSTVMLASAGLLLVFVILCVVSFITARKEMAAQKKAEAEKKKKVLDKVKSKNEDAADKKSDTADKKDAKKSDMDVKDSKPKDSGDNESKESDKKDEPEKGSEKKEDDSSKSSVTPKPEAKKEPAETVKDASETKKEEKKPEEPSKEALFSADSESSSESNSKDQEDSKEEKESAPKPEAEDKEEEKPEPKSDSEKSNKEESKE